MSTTFVIREKHRSRGCHHTVLLSCLFALLSILAYAENSQAEPAASLRNSDIVSLVKAKVSTSTIALTIQSSPGDFDTSPQEIIKLTTSGVPQSIIEAMIKKHGATSGSTATMDAGATPEEIVITEGDARHVLRYMIAGMRAKNSFLLRMGLAPAADYVSLPGPRAALRITKHPVATLIFVPEYAQPESYLSLIHFATRKNGTREAMTIHPTGFHPDRVVATKCEKSSDQSSTPKGFLAYQVTTASPLAPGEYAFVTYNSRILRFN